MSMISQIVPGGGWKRTYTERVRIKAWVALFSSIVLASVAGYLVHPFSYYVFIPAGVSLALAAIFFVAEKPREFEWPAGQASEDPRKLYGDYAARSRSSGGSPEPAASPNGGPAAPSGNSGVSGGPPSVS